MFCSPVSCKTAQVAVWEDQCAPTNIVNDERAAEAPSEAKQQSPGLVQHLQQ